MLQVRFYQVDCGDAASITFRGTDGKTHVVFIDSGYERTYRDVLAKEIEMIDNSGGQIDLWIVSHIHDDHIGGVISYIKAIRKAEVNDIVLNWWFNHPYIARDEKSNGTNNVSTAKSFAQGENFTTYLHQNKKIMKADLTSPTEISDFAGLRFTILSPTDRDLILLREKYKDIGMQMMDVHQLTEISEPKSANANDYHRLIEDFKLDIFQEDNSIENASSIVMLTDFENQRILWLADALPHVIVQSLQKLGYSESNPLHVDLVKVAHHGSKGNNSSELYNMISCSKYIFTANGNNKHQLPTKECMARILRNKNRPADSVYEFLFLHDNNFLREIFQVDGDDVYKRWRFKMVFSNSKWLEICMG